jgi:catechol 2,3-dioxygenase-like lactoylglutathione lyase family enzyme
MKILGIDAIVYGVADMAKARTFFDDWGLAKATSNRQATTYETEAGNEVVLKPDRSNKNALPGADPDCAVREVIWGVASKADLKAVARELGKDRAVRVDDDGTVHSVDDAGIGIGFRRARHRMPKVKGAPMNAAGRRERIDQVGKTYDRARPLRIGHVVFAVPDIDAAEAFYADRLGFLVSDRYVGRGVFMRCAPEGDHHNIFFQTAADGRTEIAHLAFEVRDIHEVFGGGTFLNERGWKTAVGPGRHKVSSAYFWYFENPCGGEAEYFTDMDYVSKAPGTSRALAQGLRGSRSASAWWRKAAVTAPMPRPGSRRPPARLPYPPTSTNAPRRG